MQRDVFHPTVSPVETPAMPAIPLKSLLLAPLSCFLVHKQPFSREQMEQVAPYALHICWIWPTAEENTEYLGCISLTLFLVPLQLQEALQYPEAQWLLGQWSSTGPWHNLCLILVS